RSRMATRSTHWRMREIRCQLLPPLSRAAERKTIKPIAIRPAAAKVAGGPPSRTSLRLQQQRRGQPQGRRQFLAAKTVISGGALPSGAVHDCASLAGIAPAELGMHVLGQPGTGLTRTHNRLVAGSKPEGPTTHFKLKTGLGWRHGYPNGRDCVRPSLPSHTHRT